MKIMGLDIGVRSIGWCVQEDGKIIACGVRIPRSVETDDKKESLAAHRGIARSIRRTFARKKARLNTLKHLICEEFGLNIDDYQAQDGKLPMAFGGIEKEAREEMRKTPKGRDELKKLHISPYQLRKEALERKLSADEFARVILHIANHRGYGNKHARKDDPEYNKKGGVKEGIAKNAEYKNKGYDTIGAYLYNEFYLKERSEQQIQTRVELLKANYKKNQVKTEKQDKNKLERQSPNQYNNVRNKLESYERCLKQDWLKEELKLIFEKQCEFGFKFSDKKYKIINANGKSQELDFASAVLEISFFQRPLKSIADKVGFCTFFPNEKRAPKDSLSAIEYVVLGKIINELKHIEKKWKKEVGEDVKGKICTPSNINVLLDIVLKNGEITYREIRSILNLDEHIKVFSKNVKLDYSKKNPENANFLELKTSKENPNIPNLKGFQKALGQRFDTLYKNDKKVLDDIAFDLATINDKQELFGKLDKYNLSDEQKESLSKLTFSKFLNLSFKALNELIPLMKQGKRYDEAYKELGFKIPEEYDYNEIQKELNNPVVSHILAEVVKVLTAIIKIYGQVHKINIEFTREAGMSREKRQKIENKQKANFQANEQAKKMCEDQLKIVPTKKNILKIKLWKEQGELCVYSGAKITIDDLKDETKLQIDHIYPYSRSFDDSFSNKVLVFTKENQEKGEKTPFEAFGNNVSKWNAIESLVNGCKPMSKSKKNRIFNKDFKDKEQGFIQRNFVDTSYIANVVRDYIEKNIEFLPLDKKELEQATMFFEMEDYNEKDDSKKEYKRRHIEIISGSLTSTMKHYWGLHFLDKKDEYGEYEKDRNHHLHHALDAIIISYMNASRIKAFSDFKKLLEAMKADEYAELLNIKEREESRAKRKKNTFEVPSEYINRNEFEANIKEKIFNIFVSQPSNKKTRGALHKETFYSQKDTSVISQKDTMESALKLGKVRKIGTKIVNNASMVRLDIFKRKKDGKFFGVPIYAMDFARGILPNKAVSSKEWIEMDKNYEFAFSIFPNDLLHIKKKGMEKAELCYYVKFDIGGNGVITAESHNNRLASLTENQKLLFSEATQEKVRGRISIQSLEVFEKWEVDPLGKSKQSPFEPRFIPSKGKHKKRKASKG